MQVEQSILKVNVYFYTSSRSIHISTMDEVLLCISIKHFLRQGIFSSKQLLSEDVLGKYSMFCVSENVEVLSLCPFSLEKLSFRLKNPCLFLLLLLTSRKNQLSYWTNPTFLTSILGLHRFYLRSPCHFLRVVHRIILSFTSLIVSLCLLAKQVDFFLPHLRQSIFT